MRRTEPARKRPGLRALVSAPALAFAALLFVHCHPETAPAEQKFVTVRLHDSLSRYDRVEVIILVAGDTSVQVGKAFDGRMSSPAAIPSYRLADGESRPLAIRVRGYDSSGRLVHDQLISKQAGRQVIASLLPAPVIPRPDSVPKKDSVPKVDSVPKTDSIPPRPAPSPLLKSLAISPGALAPAFQPLTDDYTVNLAYEQTSVILTLVPETDSAAILVEGVPVANGLPSDPFEMHVGVNELGIRVTVGDSTARYSIKVDRAQYVDPVDTVAPDKWAPAYRSWKYKADVAVNAIQLGLTGTEFGFPLLVRLTKENFVFSQAYPNGRDLRFVHMGRLLDHETTRWDTSAGMAEIFVRIDTLKLDASFEPITMYWGNPSASDISDGRRVFEVGGGFSGVWHLTEHGEGRAAEFKDAVGRNHGRGGGGSAKATPRRSQAVVGYGQNFNFGNNASYIDLYRTFDPGESEWTFQAWVKTEGSAKNILFHKGDLWQAGQQRFQIALQSGSGQQLAVLREGNEKVTNTFIPRNVFVHLGIAYDGRNLTVYVDGYQRETQSWTQGGGPYGMASIGAAYMPATNATDHFDGVIDELWFSERQRTSKWMRLTHENQKPSSYLVAVANRVALAKPASGSAGTAAEVPDVPSVGDILRDIGLP